MSCGLPVVAPASGGPLDLVQDGVTALLHPPDGSGARVSVEGLVADAGQRAPLGAAGRRRVAGRMWRALGDELLAHYGAVVASRAGVAA